MVRDEIDRQERALKIKHGPSFDPAQWALHIGEPGLIEMARELGWEGDPMLAHPPTYRGFKIVAEPGARHACSLRLRTAPLPAGQLPL